MTQGFAMNNCDQATSKFVLLDPIWDKDHQFQVSVDRHSLKTSIVDWQYDAGAVTENFSLSFLQARCWTREQNSDHGMISKRFVFCSNHCFSVLYTHVASFRQKEASRVYMHWKTSATESSGVIFVRQSTGRRKTRFNLASPSGSDKKGCIRHLCSCYSRVSIRSSQPRGNC